MPPATVRWRGHRAGSRFQAVRDLGAWRDAVLVMAAAFYVVGYLFWSWNAWRNNLGRLPALEAQYFVAGILPALFLVLLGFALYWAFRLRGVVGRWVALKPWRSRILEGGFVACAVLAFALLFLIDGRPFLQPIFAVVIVVGVSLFAIQPAPLQSVAQLFQEAKRAVIQRDLRSMVHVTFQLNEAARQFVLAAYRHIATGLVVLGLGFLAVAWYANHFYPDIPQAFGGVAPRCAELDLDGGWTPPATWPDLDGGGTNGTEGAARFVLVYFDTGPSLLVKPQGPEERGMTPTYEIPRSGIQAIRWCG